MNLNLNPNTYWMSIFVEELARNGLEAVCISPGSRSTPLALAFANNEDIRIYRHLDERSAGFFALGLALASERPVALVCTSGTAAANFHPAVIEAYYSQVPLLVLTADRPAELRGSGANQTIDQIKMFGNHVRWSVEVPLPESNPPELVIRHLRTLAARAYATANGLIKGPIHLNFPFRKPLEPGITSDSGKSTAGETILLDEKPFTQFSRGRLFLEADQVKTVSTAVANHPHGLIICGPNSPGGDFPEAVSALAERCGYPLFADSLSGLRHGNHVASGRILGSYQLWLPGIPEWMKTATLILRFGSLPTSSALSSYLENAAPAIHIHVRDDGEWADDLHLTHDYLQADPAFFCRSVVQHLTSTGHRPASDWAAQFEIVETQTRTRLTYALERSSFFDGSAISTVLSSLPDDAILFAGNSMPVRHVDTFDRPSDRKLAVYGNRGASGIDGNVSTALGLAAATGKHVVAILGDITFYHDMNGLMAIRQNNLTNITIIVVNNDGGSIFHRLPIARHDPPFTDLFLTPHGLKFEHTAALYGLRYAAVSDNTGLAEQLDEVFSRSSNIPSLIEVQTNSATDHLLMQALSATVRSGLESVPFPPDEKNSEIYLI